MREPKNSSRLKLVGWRSRRTGIVVAILLATVVLVSAVSAASIQGDDSTTEAELRAALDKYSLDPRIAGLGATSYDEVAAISRSRAELQAQIATLTIGDPSFAAFAYGGSSRNSLKPSGAVSSHPHLVELIEIERELERAVDDLYSRASQTDLAFGLQESWRECMKARGHTFSSPADIESAITEGTLEVRMISDAINDRDECTTDLETDFEYFLMIEYMPAWTQDNAELLSRYEVSLGLAPNN